MVQWRFINVSFIRRSTHLWPLHYCMDKLQMSEEEIRKHEEEKLEMQRNYEETMKAKLTSLDHTWALVRKGLVFYIWVQ